MPAISVSIKTDVLMGLEQARKSTGISKSKLTELALARFLEEDVKDYEAAAAAWEDYEKNGGKTYSAEEVFAEAGL